MPGFADLVLILFVVAVVLVTNQLPRLATLAGQALQRLRGKKEDGAAAPQEGQDARSDPPADNP
ncbi:MAG: twin-arginine translocase TatA/TatE family subunit [Myxococcales bacterium]|nr:twin-arginine translocase TatA/TatE family subunit [Myxococcales bacterium]